MQFRNMRIAICETIGFVVIFEENQSLSPTPSPNQG
jgi:hypothetical protein